jgi:hypothetical protein
MVIVERRGADKCLLFPLRFVFGVCFCVSRLFQIFCYVEEEFIECFFVAFAT